MLKQGGIKYIQEILFFFPFFYFCLRIKDYKILEKCTSRILSTMINEYYASRKNQPQFPGQTNSGEKRKRSTNKLKLSTHQVFDSMPH
jgi:hypothetical protein